MRSSKASNFPGEMAWLASHQMAPWLVGSLTKTLSFGERPVCFPVSAVSAPEDTMTPSSRRMACSYSAAGLRLRRSGAGLSQLGIASDHKESSRSGDSGAARASPAALLAAHVVDQDV